MQNPGILDFVIRLSFSPCVSRLSFRVLFSFHFAPSPFVIPLASSRVLSTFRFGSSSGFISRPPFSAFGSRPSRLVFRVSRLSFRVFGFHFAPALVRVLFAFGFEFSAFHFASSGFISRPYFSTFGSRPFRLWVRVSRLSFRVFGFHSRPPFPPFVLRPFRHSFRVLFFPRLHEALQYFFRHCRQLRTLFWSCHPV